MNAIYAEPPPVVLAAEQALLGAIMANNKAYEAVGAFLLPEHFAQPVHGHLYRKMAEIIGKGRHVDAMILNIELEHAGILKEVGGVPYLADLLHAMVGILPAIEYGKAIKDAWVRREAMAVMEESRVSCSLRTGEQSGQEIVSEAIARLSELAEPDGGRGTLSQAANNLLAGVEAAHQRQIGFERLEVGLPSVDRLLGGLWPGNLYFLMAHSGSGKTSALMQFCRHIARNLTGGAHVHMFSLEMSQEDILLISTAAESRWTAEQIRAGDIGDADQWLRLKATTKVLGELPIVIDDAPVDMAALKLRAREIKRSKKTRLIVIDHFDLIDQDASRRPMNLNEWVPRAGKALKDLSKELGVPVLVLRQVNKPADRDSARPTRNDLPFDKGQAADEIHAIYRREMDMPADPPGIGLLRSAEKQAEARHDWDEQKRAARGAAEWIALKRRFGPTGSTHLRFDGPRQLFREAIPADHGSQEESDMFNRGEA